MLLLVATLPCCSFRNTRSALGCDAQVRRAGCLPHPRGQSGQLPAPGRRKAGHQKSKYRTDSKNDRIRLCSDAFTAAPISLNFTSLMCAFLHGRVWQFKDLICGISKHLGLSGLIPNPTQGCSVLATVGELCHFPPAGLSNTAVLKREMLVPSVQGSC